MMHRTIPRVLSRRVNGRYFSELFQDKKSLASTTNGSLRNPLHDPIGCAAGENFREEKETRITTLSNGLRIASQDKFGQQCAMGVIVNAGPRYEVNRISGISHYLEKLGFHSSENFQDRDAVQQEMEKCNAIFDCQISRDFTIYAVSGFNTKMDRLTHILAETVLRAKITAEEVDMAERSIRFELQALERAPPVEPILTELVHAAAFRGNSTLGLPRYCPEENLGVINRDHIINFLATYYRPERMVIAGVGVQHDAFVKSIEKAFSPCKPNVAEEPAARNLQEPDTSVAQYTGGYLKVERDLERYHAPMPEFAHAVIGLESCGYQDPQFVTACLLHSLLGGGGSFSAGGPGKGMYSRLYVNVLNQFHWVNSAQAENHAYADTGLFTISGSSEPKHLGSLVHTLLGELKNTASSFLDPQEVSRAKAQLKSMLLMNLETRAVIFEDIARQVLNTGVRHQPEYWAEQIDKVTPEDLHNLLDRMFHSPVTVVGFGRVARFPKPEEVTDILTRPVGAGSRLVDRLPKSFRRFV